MRRREFISLLGGMTTIPLVAGAQEIGKVYRVGFFGPAQTSPPPVGFYRAEISTLSFVL